MNRILIYIIVAMSFPSMILGSNLIVEEPEKDTVRIPPESSIGVFWDNDIFFKTDYYYTNGVGIEWQSELLRLKILELKRLPQKATVEMRYRISLSQKMYTPTSISSYAIYENDRPYAGTIVLSYGKDKFTFTQKSTITLSIGSIGVPSGTEQTQKVIHQSLKNDTAVGWSNQVNTDLLLNIYYSKDYLLLNNQIFDMSGAYKFGLGTLESYASGQLKLRAGKRKFLFDNSGIIQNHLNLNSAQYYFFFSYQAQFTLHDATLHGGLFNASENVHTIGYGKTNPLIHRIETGLCLGIKKINIILKAEQISPEFSGALWHRYGTIQLNYFF